MLFDSKGQVNTNCIYTDIQPILPGMSDFFAKLLLTIFILTPISARAADIVFEQDNLKRFIGRIDNDPLALDGKAVFLDPLFGQTPRIEIPPGKFTAYLHARSTLPPSPGLRICQLKIFTSDESKPVHIRDIMSGELRSDGAYRTVEIPFEMSEPGRISLALDVCLMGHNDIFLDSMGIAGQGIIKRWSWQEMIHHTGMEIDDGKAVCGRAWTNAHALSYGPYISLPDGPGRYEAIFRMSIDSCLKATNIATLDVYAHDGSHADKTYAARGLDSEDFPKPGQYMEFSLPFIYDGARMMEFRVKPFVSQWA